MDWHFWLLLLPLGLFLWAAFLVLFSYLITTLTDSFEDR